MTVSEVGATIAVRSVGVLGSKTIQFMTTCRIFQMYKYIYYSKIDVFARIQVPVKGLALGKYMNVSL